MITGVSDVTSGRDARGRATSLPAAMRAYVWQPGQSGNPGGKHGEYWEALKICRDASPEAARTMVELLGSDDDRVRLMAAREIYDRAWGKPKEYDPAAERERPQFDPTLLTPKELVEVEKALRLIIGAMRPAGSATERVTEGEYGMEEGR
jgi:hypothetical protein